MKRVFALLLCIVLAVGVLASCGQDAGETHVHTYSESWSKDAEGHWYDATCDCEDAPTVKLGHADKNNDGACDICEFSNHTHTYAEEWTVDCTKHWHAADCGHTVAGVDAADHVDENADGKCDVCAYVIKDIHQHYYDSAWTGDAEYHWHAALCEHGAEVADKAAHELDAAGYCTVCDEQLHTIDMTDIEAVLAAAVARNHKVVDGNVVAGQFVYDAPIGQMLPSVSQTNEVYYVLGNGQSYIFYKTLDENGEYIGGVHQWYEQISEDEIFAVQMEAGSYGLEVVAGDAQFLNGYTYFPGSILPSDTDDTSTLANTLYALYSIVEAGVNVDNVSASYDAETGKYNIQFRYFTVNSTNMSDGSVHNQVELYGVSIDFSVDENYVIDLAEFAVASYRNWELDNDLDYDPENNTVTLHDDASPTIYVYSVSQRSGERTFTTPYPRESLIPVDFELSYVTGTDYNDAGQMYITEEELVVDEDGDDIADIELQKDEYVRLHISSLVPSTALASALNIDDFSMTFVNNDASADGVLWNDGDFVRPSYSGYMDCITFKVADPGEYTVTVTFGDVTKVLSVVVPSVQAPDAGEDTESLINVTITDTYTFDGHLFSYTAAATGTYTFTIPAELSIWEEDSYNNWGAPIVDRDDVYSDIEGDYDYPLVMNEGDVFSFYAKAAAVGNYVINVSYSESTEGGNPGGGSDDNPAVPENVLNVGNNQVNAANVAFAYTAASDGTLTISIGGFVAMGGATATADVTYTVNGGEASALAWNSSAELNLVEGDKVVITVITNAYGTVTAAWTGESAGGEGGAGSESGDVVVGQNIINVTDDDIANESIDLSFVVAEEGNYTFESNYLMVNIYDSNGMLVARNSAYLTVGSYTLSVYLGYVSGAGGYALNVEFTAPVTEADGSESNPYPIEELPTSVSFYSDTVNKVYYLFTATEDGVLTITVSVEDDSWFDLYPMVNGSADGSNSQSSNFETTATFEVTANTTYRIGLGTFNTVGDATFDISFTAVEGGAGSDEEEIVISGSLYANEENTVEVTEEQKAAGKLYYSFYPWESGEYCFSSNNLIINAITTEDGTVIEVNDYWNYELEAYVSYIVEIGTDYVNAGEYTIKPEYKYPEGHQNNPIWYTLGESTTATYAGNYAPAVWYQFYANTTGTLTLTLGSELEGVTLGLAAAPGYEVTNLVYDEETFEPIYNSSVSLDVVQGRKYYISVAAFEAEAAVDITFSASITEGEITPDGTINVPYELVVGDNTATVTDWGTVWYEYTAEANGTLTLTTSSADYAWAASTDRSTISWGESGDLTIHLYNGDVAYIRVETFQNANGEIPFTVSWTPDPVEVWYESNVITDGSAANEIVIAEENTYIYLSFYGAGMFTLTWDNADAIVETVAYGVPNTAVANGDTISAGMWGTNLIIYLPDYATGTVNLTIAPYVASSQDLVLGDNTVSVVDTQMGSPVNLTAEEETTFIITPGENAVVIYDYTNYFAGETVEITVPAGETVTINVCTEDFSASDVTVNVTVSDASDEEGSEGSEGGSSAASFAFTAPGNFASTEEQTFVASEAGTYVITATGYDAINKTYIQYYDAASDTWTTIAKGLGYPEDNQLPYSIELEAGEELKFRLYGWNDADKGTVITISIELA